MGQQLNRENIDEEETGHIMQQLNLAHTDDILSFVPPVDQDRLLCRLSGGNAIGRIVGSDPITIQTSEMSSDFMNILFAGHKQLSRLTVEIDDGWCNVDNTRYYNLDFPDLTILVLRSLRRRPSLFTTPSPLAYIERSDPPFVPSPLAHWAPTLQTLDISDVTFPTDAAVVYEMFPDLEQLEHFQIKSQALNLLCEYKGWFQDEFPISVTTLRIIVDPHVALTLASMRWIQACAVYRSWDLGYKVVSTRPSMKLYLLVHKWTPALQQKFLDMQQPVEDDEIRNDLRFGRFAQFHLDILGFEEDMQHGTPPPDIFYPFVHTQSAIHINIDVPAILDVSIVNWIQFVIQGLRECKSMTVNINIRCATWNPGMVGLIQSILLTIVYMDNKRTRMELRRHRTRRVIQPSRSSLNMVLAIHDKKQYEMDHHYNEVLQASRPEIDRLMDRGQINLRLVGETPQPEPIRVRLNIALRTQYKSPTRKRKRDSK